MNQLETIHTIQSAAGNILRGRLLKQEEVSTKELTYLLADFDLEEYGEAVFSKEPAAKSGKFRSALSMMPFDNIDKRAGDFDWKVYGDDAVELERKKANAFILNFSKFRQCGKGLFIYSVTRGTGKTLLACVLENEVMDRFDVNGKFVNAFDYQELASKKGYVSEADKEEKSRIMKASLLVLDDIGVDNGGTALYQLINYRYSNKLTTIITGNCSVEQLKVDDRIKDRINFMCLPLPLPEVPIRTMKTDKVNDDFMREVFKE